MANGNTTTDIKEAVRYEIQHGQLTSTTGGYVSTAPGIESLPFALTSAPEVISNNFTVANGVLAWSNAVFTDGKATLYKTPTDQVDNAQIIARLSGPISNDWAAVALMAMPVSGSVTANASQSTSMASVITIGPASTSAVTSQSSQGSQTALSNTGGLTPSSTGTSYSIMSSSPPLSQRTSSVVVSGSLSMTSATTASQSAIPTYACPANNGSTVGDLQGIQYTIGCGQATTGDTFASTTVSRSFDECFGLCDQLPGCLAFYYDGGSNGVGTGTCWFNGQPASFVSASVGHVAAIRVSSPSSPSSSVTLATFSTGPLGPIGQPTLYSGYETTSYNTSFAMGLSIPSSTSTPTSTMSSATSVIAASTTSTSSAMPVSNAASSSSSASSSAASSIANSVSTSTSTTSPTSSSTTSTISRTSTSSGSSTSSTTSPAVSSSSQTSSSSLTSSTSATTTSSSTSSFSTVSSMPTSSQSSTTISSTQTSSSSSSSSSSSTLAISSSSLSSSLSSSMTTTSSINSSSMAMTTSTNNPSPSSSTTSSSPISTPISSTTSTMTISSSSTSSSPPSTTLSSSSTVSSTSTSSASISSTSSTSSRPSTTSTSLSSTTPSISSVTSSTSSTMSTSSGSSSASTSSSSSTVSSTSSISTLSSISISPSISSTSTSTSTQNAPTSTPTYTCPGLNKASVTDQYGEQYVVQCGADTTGGNFDAARTTTSWNDCFASCYNRTQAGNPCYSWTWASGALTNTYGVGSGSCYFKNFQTASFTTVASGNNAANYVGAIMAAHYDPNGDTYPPGITHTSSSTSSAQKTTTTTTTTTTSSSSSTSSPTITSMSSSSSSSSSTTSTSSSTSTRSTQYLVLPSPTPCDFGDPQGTDEDDSFCDIPLSFPLQIYSKSDTTIHASTNGYISILTGSSQYQTGPLPNSHIPNNTVLPYASDMYLYGSAYPPQGIFYQASSSNITLEYYLGRYQGSGMYHFTVAYNTSAPGVFVYTYYTVGGSTDDGALGVVGAQGGE
ncbi:hypothetical protein LTR86_006669 [Recurvomyces mirabilis]|nr:hypothetical protein LTR86_006669 [Recurvomyces mirabilis]